MGDTLLLTCTGDREIPFGLCKEWRSRFTAPLRWLVSSGPGSYDLNLYRALARLPADVDKIIIMEDDDWYAPDWPDICIKALDEVALFGQAPDKVFNVRYPSWQIGPNRDVSSLASTAFRRDLLPLFMETLDAVSARFLDGAFWLRAAELDVKRSLVDAVKVVSMKGLPGRAGLGYAHGAPLVHRDTEFQKLREWIGFEDAERYATIKRVFLPADR